jgi:hypothetical protein
MLEKFKNKLARPKQEKPIMNTIWFLYRSSSKIE